MQDKLRLLLIVASFAIATGFIFIACGDGDPLGLPGSDVLLPAEQAVVSNISSIMAMSSEAENISSGGNVQPSSAGGNTPQSSAGGNVQPSSTGGNTPQSSAGGNVQPSSSASPPAQSSSSRVVQNTTGCKENNPKSGFSCAWDGTGALIPGTILKPAAYSLPSGCSSVEWKFAPDTAGMVVNYQCEKLPSEGVAALGSKNYVLFAELTCGSDKQTTACSPKDGWSSKIAPKLEGTCTWDKAPTTTARGAKPSGVTIVDTDHVCTSPTVVYKYEGGTWPETGKLPEWTSWGKNDSKTYSVEATLNCPAYPASVVKTCPALLVNGGVEHTIECNCPEPKDNQKCNLTADICSTDGTAKEIEVTLTPDQCVDVNIYGYDNNYSLPNVGFRCQSLQQTGAESPSWTVAVNGVSKSGGPDLLSFGKIELGDNAFGTLCLTSMSGAPGIKCRLSFE